MSPVIDDSMVVSAITQVLVGVIDVDGGATDEQRSVLSAIVAGAWGRADLDLDTLEPLDPAGAAAAIPAAIAAACASSWSSSSCAVTRSPRTQVDRVDEYAAALGEADGMGPEIARDLVRDGAPRRWPTTSATSMSSSPTWRSRR